MNSSNAATNLQWIEVAPGLDWVSQAIGVISTPYTGLGLAARRRIRKGEIVIRLNGHTMSLAEYRQLPEDLLHYPIQIDDNTLIGPRSMEEVGVSDMLNHSCNPNVGFFDSRTLVTTQDIEMGLPITLDYAMSESFSGYGFVCKCGTSFCRHKISTSDWKIPELQKRYSGYFQPYLENKIGQLCNPGSTINYPATTLSLLKTKRSVLKPAVVGSAALMPFEDIDPSIYANWYLNSCYPEQLFHDEKLILEFLSIEARKIAGAKTLLEIGCGPTISHALPFVPYVSSFILSDYLETNLAEISKWARKEPGAHSWSLSTGFVLQQEGRTPTPNMIAQRETELREKLATIVPGDLKKSRPIPGHDRYPVVSCFYATEQAAQNPMDWLSVFKNLTELLAPGGMLFLSCVHDAPYYAIHDIDLTTIKIPIARIDVPLIKKGLVENGFPLTSAEIQVQTVEGLADEGMNSIVLVSAKKAS